MITLSNDIFVLSKSISVKFNFPHILGILDTILSVQPKESGGGSGETRETIVYQLAEDMLRKLPPQYNSFEVKECLARMGALLPMNIFLRYDVWKTILNNFL